jgi:acid phosphatase type 7
MKKILLLLIGFIFFFFHFSFSQNDQNPRYPTRIILNLSSNPSKSMAVTWRTNVEIPDPLVQLAEATDWIDFAKSPKIIKAKSEKTFIDNSKFVFHHSVVMDELKPNTQYAYRVGSDSTWSEWNQFTTSIESPTPFEFVFFGDPQTGFNTYLPRIFRDAIRKSPEAKFWLMTGDLVDRPRMDEMWGDWFKSEEFIMRTIPSVMVPGNHEYARTKLDSGKPKSITPLWKPHFTLPENGPDSLQETCYCFDYQGVRFIMLNGQEKLDKQSVWLEKILANNSNKWTIAAVHQPMFSMGAKRDERNTRNAFMSLFDKYSVDLVLTGHDHVYSRSYKLKNGSIVKDNEKGTVYVVSVSGTKAYDLTLQYKDLMVKYAEKIQLYQVISIDNNKLSYKSYTATNAVFDSFELVK